MQCQPTTRYRGYWDMRFFGRRLPKGGLQAAGLVEEKVIGKCGRELLSLIVTSVMGMAV